MTVTEFGSVLYREGVGSDLDRDAGVSDRGCPCFYSVTPNKFWDKTINYATTTSFQILFHSLFLSFDAGKSELINTSLNKQQINRSIMIY